MKLSDEISALRVWAFEGGFPGEEWLIRRHTAREMFERFETRDGVDALGASSAVAAATRPERDYVDRILATMEQHDRSALREHWWTGAARTLADEVVALRLDLAAEETRGIDRKTYEMVVAERDMLERRVRDLQFELAGRE